VGIDICKINLQETSLAWPHEMGPMVILTNEGLQITKDLTNPWNYRLGNLKAGKVMGNNLNSGPTEQYQQRGRY
jgi:hypothetical protein